MKKKCKEYLLYVPIVPFKMKDYLMFYGLFLKICYGKFCFVNYLVNKRTLTLKIKKQVVSPER